MAPPSCAPPGFTPMYSECCYPGQELSYPPIPGPYTSYGGNRFYPPYPRPPIYQSPYPQSWARAAMPPIATMSGEIIDHERPVAYMGGAQGMMQFSGGKPAVRDYKEYEVEYAPY